MFKQFLMFFLIALLGYAFGNFIPLDILKPEFAEDILSKEEYYRLLISIISAFITLSAVIVALFKDDFREQWKRPKIDFSIPSKITIEDQNPSENADSDNIKVNKYISRIEVHNSGNLPALNAEIYLDKLEFIPADSTIPQIIEPSAGAIEWNGSESTSIIIPPGAKKLINIVEITAPEKFSTPDSEKTHKPANLIVGKIFNTNEQEKGKWIAKFSLYAQNHKATSFEIEIEWNGLWKNRLTEFNNHYKITKKA